MGTDGNLADLSMNLDLNLIIDREETGLVVRRYREHIELNA